CQGHPALLGGAQADQGPQGSGSGSGAGEGLSGRMPPLYLRARNTALPLFFRWRVIGGGGFVGRPIFFCCLEVVSWGQYLPPPRIPWGRLSNISDKIWPLSLLIAFSIPSNPDPPSR